MVYLKDFTGFQMVTIGLTIEWYMEKKIHESWSEQSVLCYSIKSGPVIDTFIILDKS